MSYAVVVVELIGPELSYAVGLFVSRGCTWTFACPVFRFVFHVENHEVGIRIS